MTLENETWKGNNTLLYNNISKISKICLIHISGQACFAVSWLIS